MRKRCELRLGHGAHGVGDGHALLREEELHQLLAAHAAWRIEKAADEACVWVQLAVRGEVWLRWVASGAVEREASKSILDAERDARYGTSELLRAERSDVGTLERLLEGGEVVG